jgi:hypothetical protein
MLGATTPLVYRLMETGKLPFRQVLIGVSVVDVVALKELEDRRKSLCSGDPIIPAPAVYWRRQTP